MDFNKNKGKIKMNENNKTIKVEVELAGVQNPEDYFNDLVEDGFSVREALLTILEDELLHTKVRDMFPEMSIMDMENLGNGRYEVGLEKIPDMMEELI
tara:strand:- start:607 stop:900 length:294 start_codon:yes stop_codon:yes gene_type:complete